MLMPGKKGKVTKKDVINTPSPEAQNTAQAASDALTSSANSSSNDGVRKRYLSTVGPKGATVSSCLRLMKITTAKSGNEDGLVFHFADGLFMNPREPREAKVFYFNRVLGLKHVTPEYVEKDEETGKLPRLDFTQMVTLQSLVETHKDNGEIEEPLYMYRKDIFTQVYSEPPLSTVDMTVYNIIDKETDKVVYKGVYLLNELMGDMDAQPLYVEDPAKVIVE